MRLSPLLPMLLTLGCGSAARPGPTRPPTTQAPATPAAADADPCAPGDLTTLVPVPALAAGPAGELERLLRARQWPEALALSQELMRARSATDDPAARSELYRRFALAHFQTGDHHMAADLLVVALEILPDDQVALRDLLALSRAHPEAYDFGGPLRALRTLYQQRQLDDGLALLDCER